MDDLFLKLAESYTEHTISAFLKKNGCQWHFCSRPLVVISQSETQSNIYQ